MKHTIILSIALFAATAHAGDQDIANISCDGKSDVIVSGRIDNVITHGKPPVHTDVAAPAPTSMISDDKLLGMPATSTVGDAKNAGANATSTGWDFKAGCVDYKEKFWAWRISKCQSVDATWVSPGEGKYLPGKEPKQ